MHWQKMDKELKFIIGFVGLGFLVMVAAMPFFGRAVMSVPAILSFCGISIN